MLQLMGAILNGNHTALAVKLVEVEYNCVQGHVIIPNQKMVEGIVLV